ncbi:hypothetical protein ABNQ39_20760 [Azospirillum sp. A26]|uniref:hypothetical protein n=1 Tax=Azospirillum sp. A26 TaxID=3160607 RepID=UPI00366FB3AC
MTRDERLLITGIRMKAGRRAHLRHSLPPLLLFRPVAVIADHPESTPEERQWGAPVLGHLRAACQEPYLELSPRDRGECESLALEIAKWAMRETAENKPRAAIWAALTVLYWLAGDEDHGLLVEESHLHHAVYSLLEASERHPDIIARYENSARKAARRLAKVLARIELFPTAAAPMKVAA